MASLPQMTLDMIHSYRKQQIPMKQNRTLTFIPSKGDLQAAIHCLLKILRIKITLRRDIELITLKRNIFAPDDIKAHGCAQKKLRMIHFLVYEAK
mmetsp:Transcript_8154/g.12194  ORF Transcript_8154/g.12194 Transcript_8154/m.12194 type:complete len:95 (+) Transcript_8154:48-332(+)